MEDAAPTRDAARERDNDGGLGVADRFVLPDDTLYVDGNSLGPCSVDAERALDRVVSEWKTLGIEAWTDGNPPWVTYGERVGSRLASLVGAHPHEVVAANSTTINIHTLVGSFLDASDGPQTVLVDELNFPTDRYAVESQLRQRGLSPEDHLVVVESDDDRAIDESAVEAALATHDVDVVWLPSVLYRSGQLLDVPRLTRAAHEHGAVIGFDLAHSIGVVPHELSAHGVDFAVWCSYKYLNAGPGSLAGLYVNERHHDVDPALAGWWGNDPDTRFELRQEYSPAPDAGRWQIGTVPILSAATLDGALDVYHDVDVEEVRARSLELTSYLSDLVDERLPSCSIGTPRDDSRRGGHVAIEHPEAVRVSQALRDRGVIVDARPPNVIRVCPAPLYMGFEEVWLVVEEIRRVLETNAYETYEAPSDVT